MRYNSAANRLASSPPAPARISMMMFFSSFGSFGVSNINKSSSSCANFASSSGISALAISASSSLPVASSFASASCCSTCLRSVALAMIVSSSLNRLFLAVNCGSLYASGCAKNLLSAEYSAFKAGMSREICDIINNSFYYTTEAARER